jgi:hypothetical protein
MPMPTSSLVQLGHFRTELHACFLRRADALFDLGEALLCAPAVVRRSVSTQGCTTAMTAPPAILTETPESQR